MEENVISRLTSKDDKSACAFADMIIRESRDSDKWFGYFDVFASLLNHSNSFVRNRAFYVLAANVRWDDDNRFENILPEFLKHITDEKPISARQCVKALKEAGESKPAYIPDIIAALDNADLSKYKDSMRPLIEKDILNTKKALTDL
ncbi:MAG: SufBD protein [Clostridia bacterium]|nr:SufBD protein [Clostridia bacterium]